MSAETALAVPIVLPPAPHVLVDAKFVATLAEVEKRVDALVVTDAVSQQLGADTQVRLTRASSELEKARQAVKAPFLKACQDIDTAARAPAGRIDAALRKVKKILADFAEAQRIAAAKAEQERQAELARLERVRQAEAAEAQRKADEIAAAARKREEEAQAARDAAAATAKGETLDFDETPPAPPSEDLGLVPEKTETEKKIEAIRFAPVIAPPKPQGITERVSLRLVSTDVNKLPDIFVVRTANEKAIRETYTFGWRDGQPIPECPGCVFQVDRTPVSTGRATF